MPVEVRLGAADYLRFCRHRGLDGFGGRRKLGVAEPEVEPGAEQDGSAGSGLAVSFERQQQRHHEPAAGGVAGDRHALWRDALVEQPAVRAQRIVQGRREGMLGRQAVVDNQHAGLRRGRQRAGVRAW